MAKRKRNRKGQFTKRIKKKLGFWDKPRESLEGYNYRRLKLELQAKAGSKKARHKLFTSDVGEKGRRAWIRKREAAGETWEINEKPSGLRSRIGYRLRKRK